MSGTGNDDVDEYVEDFHKHLSEIDKLGQIVLNAHAEVEATLNYFLRRRCLIRNILKTIE